MHISPRVLPHSPPICTADTETIWADPEAITESLETQPVIDMTVVPLAP